MITIKDIAGKERFSTEINEGAKGKFSLMKEDFIVLPFTAEQPIPFKIGDYVDLAGVVDDSLGGKLTKIYEITEAQKPTRNKDTGGYDYKLRLDAYYVKWKNKILKYLPEGHSQEASWSLTAALNVHLDVLLRNLTALKYKYRGSNFQYSIDATVSTKAFSLTYSNTNILDALTMMAEALECEWWVTDNTIHFGRCEHGNPVKIELYKEAADMDRAESKGMFATRIYAFGSEKNIPTNYRPTAEGVVVNGIVQRRLMLPEGTPYLDAYPGMTEEEAIEAVVTFDVFPHLVGTISDVTSYQSTVENEDGTKTAATFYRYKDRQLNFSKDYILEGQELQVKFESGLMNGMTFGVVFNPNGDDTHQWEIVQNEDYGRPLPDDVIKPQNGDKYVLSGYDTKFVSVDMLPKAEIELFREATEYLDRAKVNDDTFTVPLYSTWVEEDKINRTFDVGQKINLVNPAFFENGRVSRVIGFEFNLDIPYDTPTYVIGESPAYSRLGNLEEKLDSLTFKGQTFGGSSGGNGGRGVYLIRTNDTTAPSDSNVFSALKSLDMFHRKDKTDENPYLQKFRQGVEMGSYSAGHLGSGGAVTIDSQGRSHAEFDFLAIRREAMFTEVTIQDAKHVGGELVVSAAAMVVSDVEEVNYGWKLYFLQQDSQGRKIVNEFQKGDQARCQTFNIEAQADGQLGNHYWWRLVTDARDNYIIVSKEDMDVGSEIPQVGDNVTLLGSRTDQRRQSAQVISAYGDNAPSRIMYQGINSYDLTDKMVKAEYYDAVSNRIKSITYGDAFVGARDGGSYMSYTQEEGLRVKGKVEITQGSKGWQNLEGLEDDIKAKIGEIQVGAENLLLNTGFTGNYNPKPMGGASLDDKTELYSSKLQHWGGNAAVIEDAESVSGYSAQLGNLTQSVVLISNEQYTVSFKAKGTSLKVLLNRQEVIVPLTAEYARYKCLFNGERDADFEFVGDCTICEIKLERGTVATDWCPARQDSNPVADKFKKLWYLADALAGTTSIDGGLILTSIVRLGQWQNGRLQKVNGCMSGIYNDDNDVAYCAGGDLDKAIYTVMLYRDNPLYLPTAEELRNIANVVITHGGRAILNDVILRGYVYAEGGVFRGTVYASDGEFTGVVNAKGGTFVDIVSEGGTFKNIKFSESVNTETDNFYIDAAGNVKLKDVTADGGKFENVTIKKNINTVNDNFYIDEQGNVTLKGNGTFSGDIILGDDVTKPITKISSNGEAFFGKFKDEEPYLSIGSTGATFKGTINATSGTMDSVTVSSITSLNGNFSINANGDVQVKEITAEGGNFTKGNFENITLKKEINTKNDNLYIDANGLVTLKGDIILGNDISVISKISRNGDAFFGKIGEAEAYLSIDSTGAVFNGAVYATSGEFNGTVNATDGTFNGKVYATDGEFTGKITATSGSIDNVTVSNISSKNGNFSINAEGNAALNNITSDSCTFTNATVTGEINATSGTFKNITLKESVNTETDNFYIDAAGNVTLKGEINATSGTFKGDVILGNGETPVTQLNSDGTAFFGKITETGADGTASSYTLFEVTDTYGKFGNDIYVHSDRISTQSTPGVVVVDGTSNFELSKEYFQYSYSKETIQNVITIRPNYPGYNEEGILTIRANADSTKNNALVVQEGNSVFKGNVDVNGNCSVNSFFSNSIGMSTRRITVDGEVLATDSFVIVNSDVGSLTLPIASDTGKKLLFVHLCGKTSIKSISPIYRPNDSGQWAVKDGFYTDIFDRRSMFFICDGNSWYCFNTYYQ